MGNRIKVKLKTSSYTIIVEKEVSKKISYYLKNIKVGNFCIVVTTKKIYSLYQKHLKKMFTYIPHRIFYAPEGEKAKSKDCLFNLLKLIIKEDKLKRKIFISSWGGGTIGDLSGLAASLYKRGIPYIQIPTTFLAQIDASIGGKTAIDFCGIKNIIGTFYQPQMVFVDPIFLTTLPEREFKQGISEMIKYGIIKDRNLFYSIKENRNKILGLDLDYLRKIIYKCAEIKAKIVEKDEKEKRGLRTILNFGHTFAHALESVLEFKRKISHGEAVAWGMIQAVRISRYLKLCSFKDVKEVEEIIKLYSLVMPFDFKIKPFIEYLMYDKKFKKGKIRLVLIKEIGKAIVKEGVALSIVKKSL